MGQEGTASRATHSTIVFMTTVGLDIYFRSRWTFIGR